MSRTYEIVEIHRNAGVFSPRAGLWFFQIVTASGHVCYTSSDLYPNSVQAEIAAREALTQGQAA